MALSHPCLSRSNFNVLNMNYCALFRESRCLFTSLPYGRLVRIFCFHAFFSLSPALLEVKIVVLFILLCNIFGNGIVIVYVASCIGADSIDKKKRAWKSIVTCRNVFVILFYYYYYYNFDHSAPVAFLPLLFSYFFLLSIEMRLNFYRKRDCMRFWNRLAVILLFIKIR